MISPEFQEQVMQYLNLKISLEELEEWLALMLYDVLAAPESPDAKLAGTIELGLADLTDGVRTEDELRQAIEQKLREPEHVILADAPPAFVEPSASNATTVLQKQSPATMGEPRLVPRWGYT